MDERRDVWQLINLDYRALGTIFGTAGIAYSQMGGDKPAGSSAPPPIEKDTSITAQSKDEEDL